MYFRIKTIILLLSVPAFIYCQTNDILLTINNKKILKSEFIESYDKNNVGNINDNKDSTRQYLKQFIDFKLKILEAEKKDLDTIPDFISKLDKYKKQIFKNYLADKELINNLSKEAYSRMKTQIRVRHILVKIDLNAAPKDSLIAYQKTLKILKRLAAGEDFELLARQVSDDYFANINGGDLWYIKPFELPYNLENYIYNSNTNTKKYSNPIRTNKGYHIVEITNKRNNPGIFKVAHILLHLPLDTNNQAEAKVKQLADSIYFQLKIGQEFGKMAMEYSQDYIPSANGGEIPWFEAGSMPREFELAAYSLNNDDDISKPVKTRFGWHIIKRISQKNMPEYDQIQDRIIEMILENERSEQVVQKIIEKIKIESKFNDSGYLQTFNEFVDSTVFAANWKIPEFEDLSNSLFSIDNLVYTQIDFAKYIENTQKEMFPIPIENYLYTKYNDFIKQELFAYKANMLLQNDKKYKDLVNNFRDLILNYTITQKEILDKLINIEEYTEYYNLNKNKYSNYYKAEVSIFTYTTEYSDKIEKQIKKLKEINSSNAEIEIKIQSSLDKDFKLINSVGSDNLNALLDKCYKKISSGEIGSNEKLILLKDEKQIVWLNSNIEKAELSPDRIMNLVLTDYQKNIEEKWLLNLKQKYRVEINETAFDSIFNN